MIYFVQNEADELVLLTMYAKAKYDNLPAAFFKKLKETITGK